VAVVPGGRLGSACVSGSLARGRGSARGRVGRAAALRGFSLRLDAGGQEDGDGQQNRRVAYPCQAGLWHTASMVLPSASTTKAAWERGWECARTPGAPWSVPPAARAAA